MVWHCSRAGGPLEILFGGAVPGGQLLASTWRAAGGGELRGMVRRSVVAQRSSSEAEVEKPRSFPSRRFYPTSTLNWSSTIVNPIQDL